MLKILVFILSLAVSCWAAKWPPGEMNDPAWANQLMATNLLNLTLLMCKDAMYKLRMADRIQEQYKNNFAYELGLLASGILEKFKFMLAVYKHYANDYDFKERKYTVTVMLNGYHVIQSYYNEIRMERDLFLEIVEQQKIKQKSDDKEISKYAESKKGMDKSMAKDLYDKGLLDTRRMLKTEPNVTQVKIKNNLRKQRKGIQTIDKKSSMQWARNNDAADAEYKKKLRYIKWADSWRGFNPEIEGVAIPDNLAKVGLANASNFLVKELKGAI